MEALKLATDVASMGGGGGGLEGPAGRPAMRRAQYRAGGLPKGRGGGAALEKAGGAFFGAPKPARSKPGARPV